MNANTTLHHPLPPHWNTFIYAFDGSATSGDKAIGKMQTLFYDKGQGYEEAEKKANNDPNVTIDPHCGVSITAGPNGFDFVLISGEPLTDGAPVLQAGPTILNSREQLYEFYDDLQESKNGFEGYAEFVENWKP